VKDRTLTEIEGLLREELTKVIISPGVYVTLAESRSARVFIFGEVGRQGPLPYHDGLSLGQALSFVGINWATAKTETVRVVRGSLDDPSLYDIDFDNVLAAGDPDLFLEPGDMVFVPALYVTRLDRYTNQLLSPLRNLIGAGQQAAGAATTGFTGVPVP
jgi:protein involved in polysaccharide export with SLBB domain